MLCHAVSLCLNRLRHLVLARQVELEQLAANLKIGFYLAHLRIIRSHLRNGRLQLCNRPKKLLKAPCVLGALHSVAPCRIFIFVTAIEQRAVVYVFLIIHHSFPRD